jgi:hypothetical protein
MLLHATACYRMLLHVTARYCMLLHFTACYCMLLHVTAHYCMLLHVTACYCMLLHVTACYCILLHVTACHCMSLHVTARYCMLLHVTARYCTLLHVTACYCDVWYASLLTNSYCPCYKKKQMCIPGFTEINGYAVWYVRLWQYSSCMHQWLCMSSLSEVSQLCRPFKTSPNTFKVSILLCWWNILGCPAQFTYCYYQANRASSSADALLSFRHQGRKKWWSPSRERKVDLGKQHGKVYSSSSLGFF